jgi:hypothetical protein
MKGTTAAVPFLVFPRCKVGYKRYFLCFKKKECDKKLNIEIAVNLLPTGTMNSSKLNKESNC